MWELDHKEGRALKNLCFWTVVLDKTPESPLDCKEIKPVNSKGNQYWIFIGRTDAEAEAPILQYLTTWCKDKLIGKDPDAGKDWRWEEKGMTEDEMVGWHHWVWANSGHSPKASILRHSAFFTVQLSHPYTTTGKPIALTRWYYSRAYFVFCLT